MADELPPSVTVPSIEVVPPSPTSAVLGFVAGGQVKNFDAGPSFNQLAGTGGASQVGMLDGRTVEERIADIPAEVDAAGTAETKVVTHNADAAAHPALSSFITAEADRAEAAADVSQSASGLFVDLAAFDAAAVNGKMGGVSSTDPNVAYSIAQKVGGVSTLTGKSSPSSAAVTQAQTDATNAKYQFTFLPPVNIYNPAWAEDQFIYNNSNGAKAANSGGIASGLIPVEEGKYYTLTQQSPERGFFQNVYAFGAGGVYRGLASAIGANPVVPGMNPVYSDPVVTSGYRRITVYIPPGEGVTHIATSMYFALAAHTTDDFNRVRNGVQVEVGSVPTFFRPYNVSIGTLKQASLPPPVFSIGQTSVTKVGNTVYVRGSFDDTRDIIQQILLVNGLNSTVNAQGAKTCLKTETDNVLAWSNGTALDVQNDSTAPLFYNGTYIGGNHGALFVQEVTATAHGKTVVDVGSEWNDGLPRKWYLMKVVDANKLWFLSENLSVYPAWSFTTAFTGGTLTHSSGATHQGTITIGSSVTTQLWPSLQGETVSVMLDSKTPITADGTYYGTTVDVVDKYTIANPAAVLTYVRSLVGSVTQPSFIDASIAADVRRTLTYRYVENGACTVYDEVQALNQLNLGYIGATQAQALTYTGKQLWQYMPRVVPVVVSGTPYDLTAQVNISGTIPQIVVGSANWTDANNPPDRMAQIVKTAGVSEFGLMVGYSPVRSVGLPSLRKTLVNTAGFIHTSRKQYPYAINIGPVAAGTCYEIVAFRSYWAASNNPQATVCAWYRDGKNVIVVADFHQNVSLSPLKLPQQFVGLDVAVVDKSASVTVHGNGIVTAGGVLVSVTGGYGYAVLKLS